jgi:hypothetical protein
MTNGSAPGHAAAAAKKIVDAADLRARVKGEPVQRQLLLPVATTRFAGFRRLTC